MMEIFCADGARSQIFAYAKIAGNMVINDGSPGIAVNQSDAVATSIGHMAVNRSSGASYKSVKNGVVLGTHADASANDFSEVNILEGCYAASAQFSDRKRTAFHESLSMTNTELLNVVTALQTLDTTLNR
jgi:hypothetical protein